jgi:hypothetical protein
MRNKYQAGQYWLQKIDMGPSSFDYRLLFILKTYIRPETKTKTPRFVYLVIRFSSKGRYYHIHDRSINCLRASLSDFDKVVEHDLDFLVKYGSIKSVIKEVCREIQEAGNRHISWYQKRIDKQQKLVQAMQEGTAIEVEVVAGMLRTITKI